MKSKIKILNPSTPNVAHVSEDGELCVCLCEKCCDEHIRLEDLEKLYPNILISIRKEQLKK